MRRIWVMDINDDCEIVKRDDVSLIRDNTLRKTYEISYKTAEDVCNNLGVECPDISIHPGIMRRPGRLGFLLGLMIPRQNDVRLDRNLLILSTAFMQQDNGMMLYTGTIAHEIRHLWQQRYNKDIVNLNYNNDSVSSMRDRSEIDADGYAIWYISKEYHVTLKMAANVLCSDELKYDPKAFRMRLDKARYHDRQEN